MARLPGNQAGSPSTPGAPQDPQLSVAINPNGRPHPATATRAGSPSAAPPAGVQGHRGAARVCRVWGTGRWWLLFPQGLLEEGPPSCSSGLETTMWPFLLSSSEEAQVPSGNKSHREKLETAYTNSDPWQGVLQLR